MVQISATKAPGQLQNADEAFRAFGIDRTYVARFDASLAGLIRQPYQSDWTGSGVL